MQAPGPHPWEAAWKEGRWFEASPPLAEIAEFARNLREKQAVRVLDLGCGAGRHTIFLANAGFQVVGLDISQTALSQLQSRLTKANLTNATLIRHEMLELPFIDDYFDGGVCTNVLHHGTISEIKRTIGELYRVMGTNSTGFVVTLSKRDFRYGSGKSLEPDTYLFTEGDEKGIVHHFFDEAELRSGLDPFKISILKESLIPVESGSRVHFHVRLTKP